MGLLDLFVAASNPVLKLLLMVLLGSFLSIDSIAILGEDARHHLNKVVYYVFNPALIGTNLAETITFESMGLLWFMPLSILIAYIIGSALGLIVIQISHAPSQLKGLILGCCSAGNLGSMLLVIIPATCKEKGSPFGDPDVCHTHGMAYVSLSMAIGTIYLWTYVYNIVRISANNSSKRVPDDVPINNMKFSGETSKLFHESCSEALLPSKRDQLAPLSNRFEEKVPVLDKLRHQLRTLSGHINLKKLFAPPTVAAIVGFIVGVVPFIRRSIIGGTAPLHVIQDSVSLLGDGSIPALTLILGGNLIKGLKGSKTQVSVIIGIIVIRYILLPMSGILIVNGAVRFGLVNSDPLYQFVLMLQFAVPPAMNIGTITQLFGAGEGECSVIMLWTYALASVSLTLWSTFFMWLVC